ncbi:hypothetical protein [Tessaracoccus sp. OH4464_COT-324]|uniref:hypothetical protein n=1 Tax=Tessaracoccus sp. OH4464_COT-324 TaxID=2491059 RepID=UPI000F644B2E|nr:hypothetical protein [Tessaracoccus sp. OH4464_COT-324]RRD45801.1 hypothetical protein EII42_10060 [Tessaracoccus sp. OH4464_COT-324]
MTRNAAPFRRGSYEPIPLSTDALLFRYADSPSAVVNLFILTGFTLLCLSGGASGMMLHFEDKNLTISWALLAGGVVLAALTVWLGSHRMVVDATGFHLSSLFSHKDVPWPVSRLDLEVYQLMARAGLRQVTCIVRHNGRWACMIPGLTRGGFSKIALVEDSNRDLDRIWDWAARKGYVRSL